MTGPLHIGHSVRLLSVPALAEALCLTRPETYELLQRLEVPCKTGYGPSYVINMAAFEAAVFRDLAPEMPADIVRLYQLISAIDHVVLDDKKLRKRLLAFIRYLHRSPKGGRVKD